MNIERVILGICVFLVSCKTETKNSSNNDSFEIKKEVVKELLINESLSPMKVDSLGKTDMKQLIGKKLDIDLNCLSNDKCKSSILDVLFKKVNYSYILGDYAGTNQEQYYCYILGLFNNSEYEDSYMLLFDNNDILKDTLKITNKEISLNVLFEDNKKGVALGKIENKNFKDFYFEITDLYEINEDVQLIKRDLNTNVLQCPLPLKYQSEEFIGVEERFDYGVKK